VNVHIDRIRGEVMDVNAFIVHGPEGAVVVDGMLTVSDGRKVRQALESTGRPLAGIVITHPHPDHYAGLAHVVAGDDVPIVATAAVDAVIRRDDALKAEIVGPMMGDEWPERRLFPNRIVADGDEVTLGGVRLRVRDLGPGESPADGLWLLDDSTVFAGDVAYNRMHAYLADGHWQEWLSRLEQLERELPADVTLHVGHGPSGGKDLLARQRAYIETFVEALDRGADAAAAGDHGPVLAAMRAHLPTEDLLFLLDLSIDPVLEAIRGDQPPGYGSASEQAARRDDHDPDLG
jgi:glyoxylase-like metal-dependent hydrolase (beta-lactamase superfamily II)